jgi:hypothetical protein
MEKFGWEKGKGLGAKSNGITENLKINFKDDSKGNTNKFISIEIR